MKKLILIILSFLLLCSLASCDMGQGANEVGPSEPHYYHNFVWLGGSNFSRTRSYGKTFYSDFKQIYSYFKIDKEDVNNATIPLGVIFTAYNRNEKCFESNEIEYSIDESDYYEILDVNQEYEGQWTKMSNSDITCKIYINTKFNDIIPFKLYTMNIKLKFKVNQDTIDKLYSGELKIDTTRNEYIDLEGDYHYLAEIKFYKDEEGNIFVEPENRPGEELLNYYGFLESKCEAGIITQDEFNRYLAAAMYYDYNNFLVTCDGYRLYYYSPNLWFYINDISKVVDEDMNNEALRIRQIENNFLFKDFYIVLAKESLKKMADLEIITKEQYETEINYLQNKTAINNRIRDINAFDYMTIMITNCGKKAVNYCKEVNELSVYLYDDGYECRNLNHVIIKEGKY